MIARTETIHETYQRGQVCHPHEHTAFSRMLPLHSSLKVSRDQVDKNILTATVICPSDFTPGYWDLRSTMPISQYMLPKEEEETAAIIVN